MSLLTRRRVLRAALETTYGAYAAPTLDVQCLAQSLNCNPLAGDVVERAVVRDHLDTLKSLRAGERATLEFEVELAGSGAPGVPPPWGMLMLGCGAAEVAEANQSATGVIQSPSTIFLAAGASGVDGFYVGRVLSLQSEPAVYRVITGYVGASRLATFDPPALIAPSHEYTLYGPVSYTPASTFGGESSLSFDYEMADEGSSNCVRFQFKGARGEWALSMNEKAVPTIKFSFTALLHARSDGALGPTNYSAWKEPLIPSEDVTAIASVHGYAACVFKSFQIMGGNKVSPVFRCNSESVKITDRQPSGKLEIDALLLAEHDYYAAIQANTAGALDLRHGNSAGNTIRVTAPAMQITQGAHTDADGIVQSQFDVMFRAGSPAGNDSWKIATT
jgi:hypothetical protein